MRYRFFFFFVTFFILFSFWAAGQHKANLSNEEWLHMITTNANTVPPQKNVAGFALYFSQAGNIKVPYLVYTPRSYDPAHPQTAIVFLHGAILARDSFQYKNAEIANEPIFAVADTLHAIIIFPFARQDFKWAGQPAAFENIITIIKQVEQDYNIDKKRIYIGGISMGGNATFWFVNNKPEIFAGFYTFFCDAPLSEAAIKFNNVTTKKPLYSMNAKDDAVFSCVEAEAIYKQHKNEVPGWHFSTVEVGGAPLYIQWKQ